MPAQKILDDLLVTDLTSVIFGPYCTQTFADMGARVVKVEPPKGDHIRYIGDPSKTKGMGPCHLTMNRGKESVSWGLKTKQGRKALERLIAKSDVFIHNIRQEGLDRANLSFEAVKKIKPDIVYVHCVGFSSQGSYAGRPAYDDLIQALSGTASLLPRVKGDQRPQYLPTAIADKVSGLHAVYATLAALRKRDRSGKAVQVEVPMFECMTHFLLEEHLAGRTFEPPNGPAGYRRQLNPIRQPLQTSDGWIAIAPYMDGKWVDLFNVMNASHELEDERLTSVSLRYKNLSYMITRAQEYLRSDTTENWLKLFLIADIPASPVNDLENLMDDPHLKSSDFFHLREHPSEGQYWEIQPPVKFRNADSFEIRPAPHIGEHTDCVLKELGLDPDEY